MRPERAVREDVRGREGGRRAVRRLAVLRRRADRHGCACRCRDDEEVVAVDGCARDPRRQVAGDLGERVDRRSGGRGVGDVVHVHRPLVAGLDGDVAPRQEVNPLRPVRLDGAGDRRVDRRGRAAVDRDRRVEGVPVDVRDVDRRAGGEGGVAREALAEPANEEATASAASDEAPTT